MNEYADIQIDTVDHRGCMGAFIMSRSNGTSYAIPFVYDGKLQQLSTHPDSAEDVKHYSSTFFAEAKEAWMSHRDTLRSMN